MTKLIAKMSTAKRDAKIASANTNLQAWRVEQNASMKYVMDVLKAHGFTRIDNKKGAKLCWDNETKNYSGVIVNWSGMTRDAIDVKLTLCADVDANAVLAALAANNIAAKLVEPANTNTQGAYGANGVIVATC